MPLFICESRGKAHSPIETLTFARRVKPAIVTGLDEFHGCTSLRCADNGESRREPFWYDEPPSIMA
ncbi:MAG TPA: hypothetical protein VLE43_02380 [Candidatus Saccharimonadia bacterium]|nr:hypothetical protein [Candidatus Saccharimonadia bacterium]